MQTPELDDVAEDDALKWARLPEVRNIAERDLVAEINMLFEEDTFKAMQVLAAELEALLRSRA